MNNKRQSDQDSFKSLQILDELSNNDSLTQRDLSKRLGIALGLVNSYIKNLMLKGYITVKTIPPKRYTYYLTPKGLAEKSRLTYHLLQDYTRIYREARNNLRALFSSLKKAGVERVLFAGSDEVAEIAYITLKESGMELVGVVDEDATKKTFFDVDISPIEAVGNIPHDCIVLTSYVKRERIFQELLKQGVGTRRIHTVFEE